MALALSLIGTSYAKKLTQYTFGDYSYILLKDGTAEIIKYYGKEEVIAVPEKLDRFIVTSIADRAFSMCSSLTSISLPDSVVSIDENPFAFCMKLEKIVVSSDHPTLVTKDGVLFDKANKKLVCYPLGKAENRYSVPKGIKEIGSRAFASCRSLTTIIIPDSITSIGDNAFNLCDSLIAIDLPDSVTSIGDYAFSTCKSLTTIKLPDSVVSVGKNPFNSCTKLSKIIVSPEHPILAVIDNVLFDKINKKIVCYPNGKTDSIYNIPRGIKVIGYSAFGGSSSLTTINIPDSVTSIEDFAFYGCGSLSTINIPDGITSIGDSVFCFCNSLITIELPDSVTSIGDYAFGACKSLTTINIPDTVISIGDHAFSACDSLTTINLPYSVTSIKDYAFSLCDSLATIYLPESVTSIGDKAFSNCDQLTITVVRGSYAAEFCKENGLNYIYSDSLDWLKK